jgi:hypothetical protein
MCIPPAGFEPAIPTSERPKIYVLDRAGAGATIILIYLLNMQLFEHYFAII